MDKTMNRILLAYSGSLTTTAAIPWLRDTYKADVITLTLDIGQGLELSHVRERALAAGAIRAHVIDARDEFVRDAILPALRAGIAASPDAFARKPLSRALIARRLVDLARMESATTVAHGAAAGDVDRQVIEESIRALQPELRILAPAVEWGKSEADVIAYARERKLAVPLPSSDDHIEVNLWGRTIFGPRSEDDFKLTRPATDTPREPALMVLEFEGGIPVRTNGVDMSMIELIESIETIAGTHGVGRISLDDGLVAESPAAVVLQAAFSALEERGGSDGAVRVKLLNGTCEVIDVLEPKAVR